MNSLVVRPIRDGDVTAAVALIIEGTFTPEAEDPARSENYVAAIAETRDNGGDVLVATMDDEVIGVCQVLVFRHFQHDGGRCAEIESVHVRADHRSRGVGAALLEAAESLARSRGCYRIQLTSNLRRSDAHRFYLTNGYAQSHLGFKKTLAN